SRCCRKSLHLRDNLALDAKSHRGYHRLLVNIQSGTALIEYIHDYPPSVPSAKGPHSRKSNTRAPRPSGPIGNSQRCSKVPQSNSPSGFSHQGNADLRADGPRAYTGFIRSGRPPAGGELTMTWITSSQSLTRLLSADDRLAD